MSYEDFLQKIYQNPKNAPEYLKIKWVIGGLTGGSPWGTEHHARTADPEPDFIYLDEILEDVSPSITFLQYKKLVKSLVKTEEYILDDYYGNYTEYMSKKINLRELYEYLKNNGLIK
jgi:hypothetical protein